MGCMSIFAFILLNCGIIACLISFCVPFWVIDHGLVTAAFDSFLDLTGVKIYRHYHEGLWAHCSYDMQCVAVWEHDFAIEKTYEDWKKASQGLYAAGVVVILLSMLVSSFHLCCSMCKGSFSIKSALGSLVLAGVMCMGASLAVFGGFMYKTGNLTSTKHLNWGFWCGVSGVIACFTSSFFFFLDSCCGSRHEGYHMTRVV